MVSLFVFSVLMAISGAGAATLCPLIVSIINKFTIRETMELAIGYFAIVFVLIITVAIPTVAIAQHVNYNIYG